MKKNTRLDTKGFLLMETLLVSLTISGILLYMYVQYSRITDSYHRLSHYNSVEKLYRTGNLKRFLSEKGFLFYNNIFILGVYQLKNSDFGSSNFLSDLGVDLAYVMKGNNDSSLVKKAPTFTNFLKTLPEVEDGTYQLIVKYNDGEFAAITLKEED